VDVRIGKGLDKAAGKALKVMLYYEGYDASSLNIQTSSFMNLLSFSNHLIQNPHIHHPDTPLHPFVKFLLQ